jgi:hybrid cluster-associated redox disulfide protein
MTIMPDDIVDDVLHRRPATIRVFLDHRMRCVGCPIACFHSIDEACRAHGIATEAFLLALGRIEEAQASD